MRTRISSAALLIFMFLFLSTSRLGAVPDLCQRVDMKPVLSLQQLRQQDLVDYMVTFSGMERPSPEGKTPEQFYQEEVQLLTDSGYPGMFAEIEPDRMVTRRYFASVMYNIMCNNSPKFEAEYGGITNETQQLQALVKNETLYSDEGRVYKEEILSVLCSNDISPPKELAIIEPVRIVESNVEQPTTEP